MGSHSSHLWFLSCFACSLLLYLLPSGVIYTTLFFILLMALSWIVKAVSPEMGNVGEDKAVDAWSFPSGSRDVVKISDPWAKICALRQGEQTVEKYFKEFNVVWEELETIRPLPACTCGAKCSCRGYLRRERKKLKVVWFLEGLDGVRFGATRSRIMREDPLPSLNKVYDSVVKEAAQMASAAKQNQGVEQNQSQPPSALKQAIPKTTPGKEVARIEKLDHPCRAHPHPLTLEPAGSPYKCSGCQELGFGSRYRCENRMCCVLHEECANAVADNSLVFHPFFKGSNFVFLDKPPGPKIVCDACCKKVHGFVYHCSDTDKDLHPCCFKLKESISNKEGNVTLELRQTISRKCLKCNSKVIEGSEPTKKKKKRREIEGWSYMSSDEVYCFHISCIKELILDKWKKGYFSKKKMSLPTCDPELELTIGKQMVKVGPRSRGSRTTKVLIKMTTVVFELIFSVVFGSPSPLILSVLLEPF